MVYDMSDPHAVAFDGCFNARSFAADPDQGAAGDLGPEGALFIPAWLSPNFRALLVANYETSGSTRVWQVDRRRG